MNNRFVLFGTSVLTLFAVFMDPGFRRDDSLSVTRTSDGGNAGARGTSRVMTQDRGTVEVDGCSSAFSLRSVFMGPGFRQADSSGHMFG
jgi:hypothetical protein